MRERGMRDDEGGSERIREDQGGWGKIREDEDGRNRHYSRASPP
jgi:hypothetical protein